MDISYFLAKLLGIHMVLISVMLFFRRDIIITVMKDLRKSPATVALAGVLALWLGLIILLAVPCDFASWRTVLHLVGLVAVFKGVMRLAFPEMAADIRESLMKGKGPMIASIVCLLLGAFFLYMGFCATADYPMLMR